MRSLILLIILSVLSISARADLSSFTTGPVIEDTARSLINGLIREGRLEKDGDRIRRVS